MQNRLIRITQIMENSRKKLQRKEAEKKGACEKGKERRERECIAREREREDGEERELNLLLKELREVERERG